MGQQEQKVTKCGLREAPVSRKPLIAPALINAIDNIGVLANTLREICAASLEPLVWVVNENKPAKPKHYLTCDEETNVLAGVPGSAINGT